MEKPDETQKTPAETASSLKKEWLGREIKPMSLDEVEGVMRQLYADVLSFDDLAYTTTRGVGHLLDDKRHDYAKLPPFKGEDAMQIFRSLKPGDEWLDLGCGSGDFIVEVRKSINPKIRAVGFDARTWESQKKIPELVFGDIDRVDKALFPKHRNGFDLVTSASVFYHVPDYWGALARTINLLKPNGRLLISTINRPLSGDKPINNESGEFTRDPYDYGATYYRNRNIFDANGKLMSMAEAVSLFNNHNSNFKLEYHSGKNEAVSNGELSYGGGFSGKKSVLNIPTDESFIFYCFYPEKKGSEKPGLFDLSFIFARNEEEAARLRKGGFVSVQERLK